MHALPSRRPPPPKRNVKPLNTDPYLNWRVYSKTGIRPEWFAFLILHLSAIPQAYIFSLIHLWRSNEYPSSHTRLWMCLRWSRISLLHLRPERGETTPWQKIRSHARTFPWALSGFGANGEAPSQMSTRVLRHLGDEVIVFISPPTATTTICCHQRSNLRSILRSRCFQDTVGTAYSENGDSGQLAVLNIQPLLLPVFLRLRNT